MKIEKFWVTNNALVLRVDTSEFLLDFVAQMIRMLDLNKLATGVTIPHLSVRTIKNQTVLKPPFEIQKKVSAYLQLIRDLEAKIDTRTSLIQELKKTYKEIV